MFLYNDHQEKTKDKFLNHLFRSYLVFLISSKKVLLVKQIVHFDFPLILLNFFENVLPVCFYSFYNKFACFVICKNYFLFLCFCFKNLDLFDQQTIQLDFSLSTLFVIFTSFGLKL